MLIKKISIGIEKNPMLIKINPISIGFDKNFDA